MCRSDAQAAHRISQPGDERSIVVQRRLDDGEAGRRALLAGVPERRADEIVKGQVDVGRLADDQRVLAAGLGEQAQ